MFKSKSVTPFGLSANLVYEFKCNGCNATYIGETARHLCTRIMEHKRKSGSSNIFAHFSKCKSEIKTTDFKILLNNLGNYRIRVLCEALFIKNNKPKINIQASSVSLLRIF